MEWMGESTNGGFRVLPTTEILFTPAGKPLAETTIVVFLNVPSGKKRAHETPSNRQIQSEEFKGILGGLLGHLCGLHSLQIGNHEKGCQKILGLGYLFPSIGLMWNPGCYSISRKEDQGRICGGSFEGIV
jgi:hypothetical protein